MILKLIIDILHNNRIGISPEKDILFYKVMNSIKFHKQIHELFPKEKIRDGIFTDAKSVRYTLPGIQLISKRGNIVGPWDIKADKIYFDEPLSGPFFRLPIVGLYIEQKKPDRKRWHIVRVIVCVEGKLSYSGALLLCETYKRLKEVFGRLCDEKWYTIDIENKIIKPLNCELV
jgi:hypothetical protein